MNAASFSSFVLGQQSNSSWQNSMIQIDYVRTKSSKQSKYQEKGHFPDFLVVKVVIEKRAETSKVIQIIA